MNDVRDNGNVREITVISSPSPFLTDNHIVLFDEGISIKELINKIQPDSYIWPFLYVYVEDEPIQEEYWDFVFPKSGTKVSIFAVPGKSESKSQSSRDLAFIAIAVAAIYVSGGGAGLVGVQAAVAAGAVVLVGGALINQLIPIPEEDLLEDTVDDSSNKVKSIKGAKNRLEPFGIIPRIFGRHRMVPPYGAMPYTEIVGNDQFLRLLFVWGHGPLDMKEFKIGETELTSSALDDFGFPIDNFEGVELEHLFGDEAVLTFVPGDISIGSPLSIFVADHGYIRTTSVMLSSTGILPTNWEENTPYYLVIIDDDNFYFSLEAGGEPIYPDNTGSGIHRLQPFLRLYTNDVFEEAVGLTLTQVLDWQIRTTQVGADEATLDFLFPKGLFEISNTGTKIERTVQVELEFAEAGISPPVWSVGSNGENIDARNIRVDNPPSSEQEYWEESTNGSGGYSYTITTFYGRYSIIAMDPQGGYLKVFHGPSTEKDYGRFPVSIRDRWNSRPYIFNPLPIIPENYIKLCVTSRGHGVANSIFDIRDSQDTSTLFEVPATDFLCTASGSHHVNVAAGKLFYIGRIWTEKQAGPIRRAINIKFPKRAQYDIRVRRITADSSSDRILDELIFSIMRSLTYTAPITIGNIAQTAMKIKATDQLNAIVDQFSGIVKASIRDYNVDISPPDWTERFTTNPASAFREVLQGIGNALPLTDSEINLTEIEEWHINNRAAGRKFSMIRDFSASVVATLRDIAAAGRAVPTIKDGKWTIIEDKLKTIPIQHFTPRNSFGFSGSKTYADIPHALKVRFINAKEDYEQDEYIVYDTDFDESTATNILQIELPGVTEEQNIWKDARYMLATMRLRPEIYTFSADVENIVCTRGDLIRFSHDVPLFGIGFGRVKNITNDGSSPPNITSIEIDDEIVMESGKSYSIRFRLSDGSTLLKAIDTISGSTSILSITTPYLETDGPSIGDLFQFGETSLESVELIVKDIKPGPDLTAQLTCLDAAPLIHSSGVLDINFTSGDVDVSSGANYITLINNELLNNDVAYFITNGSPPDLPSPLETDLGDSPPTPKRYFIVEKNGDTIRLSLTKGGVSITLLDGGSGTHTLRRVDPEHDSQMIIPVGVTIPVIEDINSDSDVLFREPDGSWTSRIIIRYSRPSELINFRLFITGIESIQASFRIKGIGTTEDNPWEIMPLIDIEQGYISIMPVEDGEIYQIRLRYINNQKERSLWSSISEHTVIGKSFPPEDVIGFTAAQNGDLVVLDWDDVGDLDLVGYRVRYHEQGTPDWDAGFVLNQKLRSTSDTTGAVPPGSWTFLVKAFDTSGNESDNAASIDLDVISQNANIDTSPQATDWGGTKVNFIRHITGVLSIDNQELAVDMSDEELWNQYAHNPEPTSTYTAPSIVLSFIGIIRLYTSIDFFLGAAETGTVSVKIEFRIDPDGLGFGSWQAFIPGDYLVKEYQFRFISTNSEGNNGVFRQFTPASDEPKHDENDAGVVVAASGTSILFDQEYHTIPRVLVQSIIDGWGYPTNITTTGFTAHISKDGFPDSGGTADWEARNY